MLITFAVIVGTLLIQGLSLRLVVRWLGLPQDRSSEEEVLNARIHSTEIVLQHVVEMQENGQCTGSALQRVRGFYEDQLTDLKSRLEVETGIDTPESPRDFQSLAEQKIWWKLAQVERAAIVELRKQHKIGDEALHEMERDIDLLEACITPKH